MAEKSIADKGTAAKQQKAGNHTMKLLALFFIPIARVSVSSGQTNRARLLRSRKRAKQLARLVTTPTKARPKRDKNPRPISRSKNQVGRTAVYYSQGRVVPDVLPPCRACRAYKSMWVRTALKPNNILSPEVFVILHFFHIFFQAQRLFFLGEFVVWGFVALFSGYNFDLDIF